MLEARSALPPAGPVLILRAVHRPMRSTELSSGGGRVFGKKRRKSKKTQAGAGATAAFADLQAAATGHGGANGPQQDGAGAPLLPPAGEPGSRIGRYTIVETLGQGGMGKVYLARDAVIGRDIALKVITIRPDLSEEEAGHYPQRFLREAQAARAPIHPNIVAVHRICPGPPSGKPFKLIEHRPGPGLKKM